MSDCDFEHVDGLPGWLYCSNCERYQQGLSVELRRSCRPEIDTHKERPSAPADPTNPKLPRSIQKAFNFAEAIAKHIGDGFRKRTTPEIEDLLTICRGCSYYNGLRCTHRKCGCSVNGARKFFNKLAWKSEHCPIKKW